MKKNKAAEGGQKVKKPFYKKWWFWVIAVLVVGAMGSNPATDESPDGTEPIVTTAPAAAESTAPDALDLDVVFSSTFRNDVTGNWRKALVSTGAEIQDYAVAYYREYFNDSEEVHVVYNFGLNTVNSMTIHGNILSINITDYVDGEEHDAKLACGGTFLGSYQIDVETGEVVYSSFDE